ncbi:MAG: LutB/LldF family L-lactate oxidation iron-sulfur protein [Proteobacteria bacterium]|nr:LutB/LldF family L-lactate oxidation iron-sulfur protein [Pseudomonadota bacterium]
MTIHHVTSSRFKEQAHTALGDAVLQGNLTRMRGNFLPRRAKVRDGLPEFDALRDAGIAIKQHTIAHLDLYLEAFEAAVTATGGTVHWAADAAQARAITLAICQDLGARTVTKGKTMVGEEIGINPFLEAHGITPVETDLGEYIIQLADQPPSHIIAPAIHLNRAQVGQIFADHHPHLKGRVMEDVDEMLDDARSVLRQRFLDADVGITGANFLIAETGQTVIVTNEGNGDLTQLLPKAHIVLAGIEKVVPTLEDATTILRVLARSATGQEMSAYTTFSAGARREGDPDGPGAFHVVLIDNGRSALLGGKTEDILRCIRCGSCLNACPVYGKVGGHAYGSNYSGPMGAILTPALAGMAEAHHLPNASSLCGRCEEVCPMRIPIPKMLRHFREEEMKMGLAPAAARRGLKLWAKLASHPALWRRATSLATSVLGAMGRRRGRFSALPFSGAWTATRDLPAPQGESFQSQWARRS